MRKELITAASVLALMTGAALAQTESPTTTAPPAATGAEPAPSVTVTPAPGAATEVEPGQGAVIVQESPAMGTDLASAEKLMGKTVVGSDQEEIGQIEDIIIDPQTNEARQLVISSGGFLGIGEKQIAVDLNKARFNETEDHVVLSDMNRQAITDLEAFEYTEQTTSLTRRAPATGEAPAGSAPTPAAPAGTRD